jgi:hypothetical protein
MHVGAFYRTCGVWLKMTNGYFELHSETDVLESRYFQVKMNWMEVAGQRECYLLLFLDVNKSNLFDVCSAGTLCANNV